MNYNKFTLQQRQEILTYNKRFACCINKFRENLATSKIKSEY